MGVVSDAVDRVVVLCGGTLRDDLTDLVGEILGGGAIEVGQRVADSRKGDGLVLLDGSRRLDELVIGV